MSTFWVFCEEKAVWARTFVQRAMVSQEKRSGEKLRETWSGPSGGLSPFSSFTLKCHSEREVGKEGPGSRERTAALVGCQWVPRLQGSGGHTQGWVGTGRVGWCLDALHSARRLKTALWMFAGSRTTPGPGSISFTASGVLLRPEFFCHGQPCSLFCLTLSNTYRWWLPLLELTLKVTLLQTHDTGWAWHA